jgi:hypothetical protein
MFDLEKAITSWRRQIAAEGLISPEVLDELESHLREEIERQVRSGVSEERAYEAGISSIGDTRALKVEFAKLGSTRRGSRKALQAFYFGSVMFLVLVNTWNLLEFEPRPTTRFSGIAAVCLMASYLACLPYLLRSIPDLSYSLLTKGIKLASSLVWLWPAWAILESTHSVSWEPGVLLTTVLWCLCAAIGLSVIAFALNQRSRGPGGPGNPPWPLLCSGQPIPPFGPAPREIMGSAHPIVQHSLEIARGEAARLGHDYVGTEHMLLGLLKLATGSFADLLRRINLDGQLVRTEIERIITPVSTHPGTAEFPLTPRARKALRIAMQQAEARNHSGMSAEDVFFGLLLEGSGVAARALKNLGVRTEKVREAIDANQLRDN